MPGALRCESCVETNPFTHHGLHNNLKKISAFLHVIYAHFALIALFCCLFGPLQNLVKANVVGLLEDAAAPIPLSSAALARDDFTRIFQRGYASM